MTKGLANRKNKSHPDPCLRRNNFLTDRWSYSEMASVTFFKMRFALRLFTPKS